MLTVSNLNILRARRGTLGLLRGRRGLSILILVTFLISRVRTLDNVSEP
jgi:hypothetical protein